VGDGRIVRLVHGKLPALPAAGDGECVICPGFVDAHLHLPQIDAIGCDGMELLDWLNRVIYPAEARWGDGHVALAQLRLAFERLLRAGTLGFAGYLTPHAHGLGCAVHVARQVPLRCIVGQVLMDRGGPQALINQSPQPLRPVDNPRLTVSVNPRFAVACTDGLLRLAGQLTDVRTPIQTHLAESARERELVRQLFPSDEHYAAVYDRHGLVTANSLLAHAIHLNEREWSLIAARRAVVVHCPTANVFLRSGIFDLNAARSHGVRVALGSDVAAGADLDMPRVARAMIDVAKLRQMTVDPAAHIPTPAEAWDMITRGNADALGWPDAGRLEPGAAADLLVLRPEIPMDEHLIGRLIHGWRDSWIEARVLAGRLI
jgi:guanine deaminase